MRKKQWALKCRRVRSSRGSKEFPEENVTAPFSDGPHWSPARRGSVELPFRGFSIVVVENLRRLATSFQRIP